MRKNLFVGMGEGEDTQALEFPTKYASAIQPDALATFLRKQLRSRGVRNVRLERGAACAKG